ncbi:hypothetical protein [uncultured Oscillibacter sp.]|jgi:hypothetical protein|nr:hypothetical protein [uncultured Oscillibacter sp.]
MISLPKIHVFRLQVNSTIRKELEAVYAKNGPMLTNIINVFSSSP